MNVPSSTFLLCSQLSLKALTIFRRCRGSSEPSLLAYAIGTIISWTGLFHRNAINQDLESWYNQIILGLCVCAYTISVIMNSQDLPYVVSWGQQDTPRSAKQFVKMFHLFEPRKSTCSPGPCHKYQQAIYEIFWYQFIWGTAQVDFVSGPSCTSIKMLSGSHAAWVSDYKRYMTQK